MGTNPDFSDMLAALSAEGAIFLLVGGHAVMQYTAPRYTKDLDLWVRPDPENAERVFRALSAVGAPLAGVEPADFAREGTIFQIGVPPNRIDLITAVDGVAFDEACAAGRNRGSEAWATRVVTSYGDERAAIPSAEILLQNKRASGRPQDLVDVAALERAIAARKV